MYNIFYFNLFKIFSLPESGKNFNLSEIIFLLLCRSAIDFKFRKNLSWYRFVHRIITIRLLDSLLDFVHYNTAVV
jgi:hypothetical protein